ncbi:MAG: GNAT family N-acetyltransferase [Caldilineaceae bacterium]|nr:GNAT family N-acetyltransferase [Caldilineaceae bacterium]
MLSRLPINRPCLAALNTLRLPAYRYLVLSAALNNMAKESRMMAQARQAGNMIKAWKSRKRNQKSWRCEKDFADVKTPSRGCCTVAGGELPKTLSLRQRWRDFIYYRDTPIDMADKSAQIRLLTHLDEEDLTHLQSACAEQEIQAAQISIVDPLIVGYFVAEQLVGAASLLYEGSAIADVGIPVHPAYRRKGMAVALVQCVANLGMAQGKIIQYTAEERNHGSVHTAGRSGFELFLFEDGCELLVSEQRR